MSDTMAIVKNDIWSSRTVVDRINTFDALLLIISNDQTRDAKWEASHSVDFTPVDWTLPNAVP